MRQCETCGKEISVFNAWETNGKTQCKECYEKEFNEKHNKINNNETSNNESKAVVEHDFIKNVQSSNGWASAMKTILIILLIILLTGGIILSYYIGDENDNLLLGLFSFVGFSLGSFVLVGMSMALLQLAEDVSYLKNYFKIRDKGKKDFKD